MVAQAEQQRAAAEAGEQLTAALAQEQAEHEAALKANLAKGHAADRASLEAKLQAEHRTSRGRLLLEAKAATEAEAAKHERVLAQLEAELAAARREAAKDIEEVNAKVRVTRPHSNTH